MHRRLSRVLALPVTAAVLVLSAVPAAAQTVPTTPEPEPSEEGQAPISSPRNPKPTGKVMASAGTALGVSHLGPEAVPADSVLPGMGKLLPKQSVLEAGFGVSKVRADSESYLSYERSVAEAIPFGSAVGGDAPTPPGTAAQTALPDNAEPRTASLAAPDNPFADLSGLDTRAHARWSPTLGPCVGTIADASTSAADLSLAGSFPEIPGTGANARSGDGADSGHDAGDDQDGTRTGSAEPGTTPEADPPDLAGLADPLARLGGLLSDGDDSAKTLLSVPNTLSTRSVVRLIDMPGSDHKAVESISTMRAGEINILEGTPLGFTLTVANQPTLRTVSTGAAATSTIEYTAPVLSARRDERTLFQLDAANPTRDVPIGIPLPGLEDLPGLAGIKDAPIIGGVARLANGKTTKLSKRAFEFVLDIGVLRLGIAELDKENTHVTDPFAGHRVAATARMLDVELLPTERLRKALPSDLAERIPSALARASLGEQVAGAYAPEGGVECASITTPVAPPGGGEQPKQAGGPPRLAHTSAAYSSVPLFWSGTAMLMIGAILVAIVPYRRNTHVRIGQRPSPRPREH